MDASGPHAFQVAIEKLERDSVKIVLSGVQPQPMRVMTQSKLVDEIGLENVCADIDEALVRVKAMLAS